MNKYLAEVFGTFTLTLAVAFSLASDSAVPTSVLAAMTLGLVVYSLGAVSGAHINPAITVGLWSINKIKSGPALGYLISQFIGALVALYVTQLIVVTPATLNVEDTFLVGASELAGALFFAFGVATVAYGRVTQSVSGLMIAGSLLLGLNIAGYASNAIINPAVALGIGSFSLMYVIGPLIGAIVGMWLFKLITGER